jgi:hypothetical protein
MTSKWSRVSLSLATDADKAQLAHRAFDYTKLSAINMCPTWGIIRYTKHLAMPGGGRSMALEAGSAMHECFALVRLIQLGHPQAQNMREHMQHHGSRMFGDDRWGMILAGWNDQDLSVTLRNCALECLATAGYVDDPYDKRRTYVNLETALMYYTQRWDSARYPIWVRDVTDPESDVGVEIPFAIKVQPYAADGFSMFEEYALPPFLYTGRVDGLHLTAPGSTELLVQENKTASRLDDAWRMSFDMSHQVTGYCVAGSLFSGTDIQRGLVLGLSLPLPRYAHEGLALESVRRLPFMKARWLQWLEYTVGIHDAYADDVLNAPRHTHSCNRYFRPCSMIPLCASDEVDQRDMLAQMVHEEWSPLHEKAGD